MKRVCQLRGAVLLFTIAVLFAGGCGKKAEEQGVTVGGKVVDKGQPIKFLPDEEILITFSQVTQGGQAFGATGRVNAEDGTFTTDKGLPPGSYEIDVVSQIYGKDKDRFKALGADKTKLLRVELGPEEGQNFIVDVGMRTAQKQ